MDYFQGVVTDYLRANRATFVNTECCIQLNSGPNPDNSGPHWYCDAVAVNLHEQKGYLCEITYSKTLGALSKRLSGWSAHWELLRLALERDCGIPVAWQVRPWLFVPKDLQPVLAQQLGKVPDLAATEKHMPNPKVTWLEDVTPWKYNSWHREHRDEDTSNVDFPANASDRSI
jgi:hypothetical protein